ncbi:Phytosulfokine [Macleaya cordata]|uniref:Phytosulfokine n=1 Tax=Macleaya cordata TaxID=56857 RepID=A0A200QFX1_MACCD|nr:Phytosulfokine [Macleaya cordata]
MSKLTSLFFITLVLFFSLSLAARHEPDAVLPNDSLKAHHGDVEVENTEELNESCDGVGEEECLMRRTLAAHIDYIYTQKAKP